MSKKRSALVYGFIHNDATKDLFAALFEAEDTDAIQLECEVSLFSAGVDVLAAFSAHAGRKSFDDQPIATEQLQKMAEYDQRIDTFLRHLEIDPPSSKPGWHLLAYMD